MPAGLSVVLLKLDSTGVEFSFFKSELGVFESDLKTLQNLRSENRQIIKGEGNLIFCCTGSRENYIGLVGRQSNNNNPQFQGRRI